VTLQIFDLSGKRIKSKSIVTDVPANSITRCFTAELPVDQPDVYLVRLYLSSGDEVLSQNEYWQSNRHDESFHPFNNLAGGLIKGKIVENQPGRRLIELSNHGKDPLIGIKLNLFDGKNDMIFLPAYISDGYFTLLPGEKRVIEVAWDCKDRLPMLVKAEGFNLKSTSLITIN
jgi:hypothetical protein